MNVSYYIKRTILMIRRSIISLLLCVVLIPVFLIVLLYVPPVQQWAVDTASEYASKETGMDINVGKVRLTFPLALDLQNVKCIKQNDSLPQVKDTIAYLQHAIAEVQLMPLFQGNVKVNAIELIGAKVNTSDFIHEARVKGFIGRLAIVNDPIPVADIDIAKGQYNLCDVVLDDAHVNVELSDTVPPDTTKSETPIRIRVNNLSISRSDLMLHMPGDSMRIAASLDNVKAADGDIDLLNERYYVGSFDFNGSRISYDKPFEKYSVGEPIDVNHLAINDVRLKADSILFKAPELSLLIRDCAMKEQSGIELQSLKAKIKLDSSHIDVDATLNTPSSKLYANVAMDYNAFDDDKPGNVKALIDASIGHSDIAFAAGKKNPYVKALPKHPLSLVAKLDGNIKKISIPQLKIEMPTCFALDAKGDVEGVLSLAKNAFSNDFRSSLHADVHTYNLSFVKAFMDKETAKIINIPATHAIADLNIHGANYDLNLKATEGAGKLNAKAKANLAAMIYDADVKASGLQLGHFVTGMGLGAFSGTITAQGKGTDITNRGTKISANADIQEFVYDKYDLNNISANVLLQDGRGNFDIVSENELVEGTIGIDALLEKDSLDATLTAEVKKADLKKLKVVENVLDFSICTHIDIESDYKDIFKVQGLISDITLKDSARCYRPDDIALNLLTDNDTTFAKIDCGDFFLHMNAQGGYRDLMETGDKLLAEVQKQWKERTINQVSLREIFPTLSLKVHSSQDNPIYRFVKYFDIDYKNLDIDLSCSKEKGIFGNIKADKLITQGYQLDTITVDVKSNNDPMEITYNAHVKNVAPNEYIFNVFFTGQLLEHGASLMAEFYDAKGLLGVKLGTEAILKEESLVFHLMPEEPIIGYKPFKLNKDNYLSLGKGNRVSADVRLLASDNTSIQIYSTEPDETLAGDEEEYEINKQDLTLSLNKMNLENLLSALPYAPSVKGMLNGDVHFVQGQDGLFTLSTDISTNKLVYEGCPVGNLGMQMVYMPKEDGAHFVDGHLALDDNEIAEITGSYNFNSKAVDADLAFYKFPLSMVNGFIPDQIIGMEGTAEGQLKILGTSNKPDVNGELFLESANLVSVPYGVKLRFDDDPITITNSTLLLENLQMYSNNNQPLVVRGSIDFKDTEHINLDVRMRAEKFLLVDSKEMRNSEAYGQAYVNIFAMINGELDQLNVRGKLEVLPSTNLFYILRDSPLANDNRLKELVTFTDLTSEKKHVMMRPTVNGLNVNLNVVVDNGSHVKCWLNTDHSNYVDIIGEGDLRLQYKNDETSLIGRYTINEGEMKYSLPVIPLKTFTIAEGSYVEFTGDILNPRLNITAIETKKASAPVNGTNQQVLFNTGVIISKTLNDMGLEFTIDAPENQTISDEINMTSKEERAKLAVTMLTTGMYLSDANTASFSMNSALNSFLQSEINNIAGNALKTLDFSFGMDNSTEEDGTMHTNYNFKFAKRFWNNRISISIGGKISDGPEMSGREKTFFDNVDVQYKITDNSNQFLQLFYRNSVYDYLEGNVMLYGVGYMWKRKMQYLKDIFRIKDSTAPGTAPQASNARQLMNSSGTATPRSNYNTNHTGKVTNLTGNDSIQKKKQ